MIVGGGMSGLTAAYLLQKRDFLLLEKEPHFGGNAYLMEYQGQAYATGVGLWRQRNRRRLRQRDRPGTAARKQFRSHAS